MSWSIERRPPLLVSVLLLAVAGALLAIGFGEVRRASRALADARIDHAAHVVADLLQRSLTQQRTALTGAAGDAKLARFAAALGRGDKDGALQGLRRLATDTTRNAAAELWAGGHLLLHTGRFAARSAPLNGAPDSVVIGPLTLRDTLLYYESTVPIREGSRVVGWLRQIARVQLSAQTRSALTGLAGGDVLLLLGNAHGDPWTDFGEIVPAPPDSVRASKVPVRYARGEVKRALVVPVAGSPWMAGAELPSSSVRAPASAYLRRMIPLGAVVVIVGALAAWLGSRRISRPLRDVALAAEAIATGDMRWRAEAHGPTEVQSLARSFNTMAEKIAASYGDLEQQVADRTRDLEATNAELESFSYSVSHDLRAPLRAIHGFARILLEDHKAQLDPEAQRLLGVIDQNTRRMGQLIDDLLSFSRLGRQELVSAPVNMRELARGVADEVRRAEGDRPLEIAVASLPPARGDRALLRQVVSNLLENAVKFTRGNHAARVEVGHHPDGGQTVYYVKDNGAGFDERYADKLFGVFQRLHPSEDFEGTGVGLAIVKRIVQRHGGRVWAQGKVNGGATFYFTLPPAENGAA